jgi:hypothetical protein
MTTEVQSSLQAPGEIAIQDLYLVAKNLVVDLQSYMVELNIYESIFSNVLSGDLLMSDSRNLIKLAPLLGEEYLIVKLATPGLNDKIWKTFRIVSVEDRKLVRDQNTQIYKLRFISQEALIDSLSPLYSPFSGSINKIIEKIYTDNLKCNRTMIVEGESGAVSLAADTTELLLFGDTTNQVKFVSPGWTPFQCINWLTKKSIPKTGLACNFLFWETNKGFYFGNIEQLMDTGKSIGKYEYSAISVTRGTEDISVQMGLIQSISVLNGLDHFTSSDNGYFASKLIAVDLFKKKGTINEYDHVSMFSKYKHLVKNNPQPLFSPDRVIRNLNSHLRVYPTHTGVYEKVENNYNERMGEIYGNRLSNMLELNSLKLNISIYGRTDIEAGRIMDIRFPDMSPSDNKDLNTEKIDNRYSGNYLITSIHHKINSVKHMMSMEVIRDSLESPIKK